MYYDSLQIKMGLKKIVQLANKRGFKQKKIVVSIACFLATDAVLLLV
jgi:hypothetical protein